MFLLDSVEDNFDIRSLSCPVYLQYHCFAVVFSSFFVPVDLTLKIHVILKHKIKFQRKEPLQNNLQGLSVNLAVHFTTATITLSETTSPAAA